MRPPTPAAGNRIPRPGELLQVGEEASVQFAGTAELTLRVISVDERKTYEGWIWLTGYALDAAGNAVDRRTIFVQLHGLYRAQPAPPPRPRLPSSGA